MVMMVEAVVVEDIPMVMALSNSTGVPKRVSLMEIGCEIASYTSTVISVFETVVETY